MEWFTKGPWHAKGFGELNNLVCNVTQDISVYSDDAASGKAESDAYLIAAAPEMYEFIKRMLAEQKIVIGERHFAESLLAKARGEK